MRILEILNAYPSETFIREHAKAIIQHTDMELCWAFWQTSTPGKLKNVIPGLKYCVGLINPNRLSKSRKAFIRLRYLNNKDSYIIALKRQVRDIKPDIIHFHFATLAVQHHSWVLDLGIPFTFSVRGSDVQTQSVVSQGYSKRLAEVSRLAMAVHTVCDHLRTEYFRICGPNNKTTTIRTAIGSHWSNLIRQPINNNILSVGRLHWRKGYPDLLVACRLMVKKGIKFKLTIVGEGEQRPMLEYMIRDLNLKDAVKLVGKQDVAQIGDYLQKADVFVLSSVAEGFPNVVGEAAFAKVPIIATEDAFITEVFVRDSEVLIAPTGNPNALSMRIIELMGYNSEKKDLMITSAFEKAGSAFSMSEHGLNFFKFWSIHK